MGMSGSAGMGMSGSAGMGMSGSAGESARGLGADSGASGAGGAMNAENAPPDAAAVEHATESGGGCGCRVGGRRGPGSRLWLALLVGGVALRRPRPRQSMVGRCRDCRGMASVREILRRSGR
jgi:MYXO-CTERM domain-containing protein